MDTGETLTSYEENMIKSAKQILHIMKSDTTGKYAQKIEVLRDLYYVKFGVRYEEVIQKLIDTGKLSSDLIEVFESATSTDPVDAEISRLLEKLSL
jgi:L-ribulose-5-phosphate 3-epimerase UlaE